MNPSDDDQRWMDVLAGKAHPCNADERIAAGLRECFRREEQQQAHSVGRLLATDLQPPDDLVRSSVTRPLVHSAAAGLCALGLLAALWSIRGAAEPPLNIDGPLSRGAAEVLIVDPDPEQLALQVQRLLLRHGVTVSVTQQAADWVLSAEVAEPRRQALADDLGRKGLTLSHDGHFSVRISACC